MFADLSLVHRNLKDITEKNLKLCERKELVNGVIDEQGISIPSACKIVCMSRSMCYCDHKKDNQIAITKLMDIAS